MEKSKENNDNKNFLKTTLSSDISKDHKDYLGTEVPEDYFRSSKLSILNKIRTEGHQTKFLHEDFSDINLHHKDYLGTTVPLDYFESSKLSILNEINSESEENKFLNDGFSNISEHHQEYLGTSIPEDYFSKSKHSILDKISEKANKNVIDKKPKKQLVFYMRPQFRYFAAASLVFILSLTVWLQNSNNKDDFNTVNVEAYAYQDDILINSLLVDDSELDAFADATLFNEVLVKAELSEQKLDNLILNSLIVEDSLLDNYMDDEFVETIIL